MTWSEYQLCDRWFKFLLKCLESIVQFFSFESSPKLPHFPHPLHSEGSQGQVQKISINISTQFHFLSLRMPSGITPTQFQVLLIYPNKRIKIQKKFLWTYFIFNFVNKLWWSFTPGIASVGFSLTQNEKGMGLIIDNIN